MVKGRTGGSMGGRLVPVGPRPYELNEKLCSECAALKGTPCIRASWETRTGSRPETHRSWAERVGVEFPFTDEFVAKQRARNRRPSAKKKKKRSR